VRCIHVACRCALLTTAATDNMHFVAVMSVWSTAMYCQIRFVWEQKQRCGLTWQGKNCKLEHSAAIRC
jgi:hypothetical protein